jgi:hypothetical protein
VYSISKSAVVPGTVRSDEELVEANSKLTVLSALAVVVAAVPGGILLKLGGGGWSVGLGAIVFGVGTVLALQLPPTTVAAEPPGEAEKEELRSAGIVAASSAMGSIRGIVGFLAFMLAFSIKENGALWELGLVAAAAQVGFFCGAVAAPRVRKLATEEHIIAGALIVTAVVGIVTAVVGGLLGAAMLSLTVGATGSAAKQAFDSIVQRDAPDANRGRSFARFETRFQLVWVTGALLPIIIPIPADLGFAIIGVAAAASVVTYLLGTRRLRQGKVPVKRQGWRRRAQAVPEPSSTDALGDSSVRAGAAGSDERGFGAALEPSGPGRQGASGTDPTAAAGAWVPPPVHPAPGPASSPDPAPTASPAPTVPPDPSGPVDPTVVAADPTIVAPTTSPDPARRWMRARATAAPDPPPPPMPGSLPLPFPDTPVTDAAPVDEPSPATPASGGRATDEEATDADRRAHHSEGLLFGPEAWEDTTTPPGPSGSR